MTQETSPDFKNLHPCVLCDEEYIEPFKLLHNRNVCMNCYCDLQRDEWISVKDELPPIGQDVLIIITDEEGSPHKERTIGWRFEKDEGSENEWGHILENFYPYCDNPDGIVVTHWQPLPEPPLRVT